MVQQLSLPISLKDDAKFDNFYPGSNSQIVHTLQQQLSHTNGSFTFLWGQAGCGLSHLLQASGHYAGELGIQCIYLPLDELADYGPELLEGIASIPLVIIDHFDAVLPNTAWEEAFFHLFNDIRQQQGHLLIAAQMPPNQLAISLQDLVSRLNWGITFQIRPLQDDEKVEALILRANQRGLNLAPDVARYMLKRIPRSLPAMFELLDKLDHASLVEQKKLTIPFVKAFL